MNCKVRKVLAELKVRPYASLMKTPESMPVEEARKKFADILDGTQHHSQHVEITRRGKRAGVVVPPEWYDSAVDALDSAPAAPAEEEH